jgi:hypothetical protein
MRAVVVLFARGASTRIAERSVRDGAVSVFQTLDALIVCIAQGGIARASVAGVDCAAGARASVSAGVSIAARASGVAVAITVAGTSRDLLIAAPEQ